MYRKIWLDFGKTLSESVKSSSVAIKKLNLDWNVIHKDIEIIGGPKIKDKVAIVREDTNDVFGIVNSTYKSIQNVNVFSFLDEYVKAKKATFFAGGYIGKGEKIWLLIKLNDKIEVSDNDIIEKLILFSNAHDGRGAIRAYFAPLRKKSLTFLNIFFGKRVDQGVQIRHVGKLSDKLDQTRNIFTLSEQYYKTFQNRIEKIYKSKLNKKKTEMLFENVFSSYSLDSTRTKNMLNKIEEQYEKEVLLFPDSRDTAWAWFNSISTFIDHQRLSKGKDFKDKTSNHLESLFWGSGLFLKQRTWDSILTIIEI